MIDYFLLLASVMILLIGAIRDGISDRAPGVGWLEWHFVTWIARELPVLFLLVILLERANYFLFGFVLFAATFHDSFYELGVYLRSAFRGDPEPPRWFNCLRKLWSWLPWS